MRVSLLFALLGAVIALFWIQREHVPEGVTEEPSQPYPVNAVAQPEAVAGRALVGLPNDQDDRAAADAGQDDLESLATVASALMHAANTGQACLAGTGQKAPAQGAAIHRWVDAAGIVHFSDQAPEQAVAQYRRIEVQGLPPVRVEAHGVDVNLPDYVVQRATMDAQAIERILRSSVELTGEPGLVLNIEYFASPETYARRVGSAAMANSDGTYSSSDRTIRIRLHADAEVNFQILRHEITHALIHEHVGQLTTAINEGLAGYFEQVEVSGMGARIVTDGARRRPDASMSVDGQEELVDLLAQEGDGFYGAGQELRYFRSRALISLLMERSEGRATLAALLAAQRATPCQPVESGAILDNTYPGGLEALAREWSLWLRNPAERAHSY